MARCKFTEKNETNQTSEVLVQSVVLLVDLTDTAHLLLMIVLYGTVLDVELLVQATSLRNWWVAGQAETAAARRGRQEKFCSAPWTDPSSTPPVQLRQVALPRSATGVGRRSCGKARLGDRDDRLATP